MRVERLENARSLSFCRALTNAEEKDFQNVTNEAVKTLGIQDGTSLFKVFSQSLPQGNENTGIGKINSDSALEYLKFVKVYSGANAVKIYPIGEFKQRGGYKNWFCPYLRSGTSIGIDNINFFKLQDPKYGSLLPMDRLKTGIITPLEDTVDFENELGENGNGLDRKLLELAHKNLYRFKTPQARALKAEFEDFKANLKSDTFDRLAIVPFIKESDSKLFEGIDKSPKKQARFEKYKEQYSKEIDLYKFEKFLSLKNLKEAKENLKKEGLELYGDCPIGFSDDEVIAFPDAFYPPNISPGWGFRAIKYDEIPKEGSAAQKLFKEKISWHIENFDGIRFDVGWQYFSPKLLDGDKPFNIDVKNRIIEFIEKTAKEIKGSDYDTKKLMYECDANGEDFQMFNWGENKATVQDKMLNRTPVITTVYEHSNGFGWGNPDFYKKAGLKDYMIGTNNHDSTPLRMLAEDDFDDKGDTVVDLRPIRKDNITALSKSLGLSSEFLSDAKNFVKAKFAELFLAKNHFVFFNDFMGFKKRTDAENTNSNNYRIKITNNYERTYHTALQNHRGFNLAESLRIAMKAKKLDKTNPELYQKISEYSDILSQKGAKTKEEAEKQLNCSV